MPRSSVSSNIANKLERINRLFLRMSVIYGHIWISQFRQADYLKLAKQEWAETLSRFANVAVENAIKECRKQYEMPPTLPQFYQLCKRFQPRGPLKETVVDKKQCSPTVVRQNMTKIRDILAKRFSN